MPSKRKQPDANEDSQDDHHVIRSNHSHAKLVGFFEDEVPENLYGLWRRDVAYLMKQSGIYEPQRAGTDAWTTFLKHAAALPTMAPISQINYLTDKSVSKAVNILAQDIAKKVRSGAVIRDKAVKAVRKGHAAKYPDDPSPPTLGQLLPPLPTAPQDTSTVMLDTSTRNSQSKRIRTPETIKGLQRKGMKGKQEYNRDEDKDEGEEADTEEPGKTLRGPKCIVGAGKGMGYLKPVLKGGKRIVGKVVNIEEDDDEEEEEEAPKNIRTRSRTESVVGGTGMFVNIEEDEEDEEEEVPKNIKIKSGKVKVGGGKGSVRPLGTRTSKKVVDDKEEEEAPTYIYMKTKSGTGSVGAGKGIVMNIEDDDEEEEEAPTYTYMKTKSGTGSVGAGKGIVRPKWIRTFKKVVNAKDDNEEEEEAPKKNNTRTGNVSVGGGKGIVRLQVIRISKKVVNFEVDDEEEEEEKEEEDEVPAYIKTKSRKGYVGGAKGIVGGSGSGKSKGMVKMSGVQIIRVQQKKEDEEEEEEAAEEEGQEEAEVEEDMSSAGCTNCEENCWGRWRQGTGEGRAKTSEGSKKGIARAAHRGWIIEGFLFSWTLMYLTRKDYSECWDLCFKTTTISTEGRRRLQVLAEQQLTMVVT
ncbi:hypothetical protein EV426DRAFT_579147 [Tirmania nivea]|nr:hypothetical protein EV426DRAFT_579147 [Tirmania nivea]